MDNRYMRVRQSVDERLSVRYRDPVSKARVVVGIQPTDQGEVTFRDETGVIVGKFSTLTEDFQMIPEAPGQEERVVLLLQGEKTRLWTLNRLRQNHDNPDEVESSFRFQLDENAQVIKRSQYLYGTLLVRDNLDNDRAKASGVWLALEMFESTTRGDLVPLPSDTSDVVYE